MLNQLMDVHNCHQTLFFLIFFSVKVSYILLGLHGFIFSLLAEYTYRT